MSIRIIIADDHQIVRQGLKLLLEKESDMELVGEAQDGRITVNLVKKLLPDVVVMDVKMPELNGIEATRQILSELPAIKIIALSIYGDRRFVIDMLKAGAQGYLLKDCAFEELTHAIRLVMANKSYLSPGITEVVIHDYVAHETKFSPSSENLTRREREVLTLLAEGKRTGQIAGLLDISPKTVDSHRLQLMHKLGLKTIADLTKYALREGLIKLED